MTLPWIYVNDPEIPVLFILVTVGVAVNLNPDGLTVFDKVVTFVSVVRFNQLVPLPPVEGVNVPEVVS